MIGWGPVSMNYFYHPLYASDVGASLRCFQIYSVLRFNKFFQIQTGFIFYVAWGPMCIFFGFCGHSSNFAFWALPFLSPTNDIVILCVIWWGPVSKSYSL